jgi:preprotein translocase subunit SecD
MFNLPKRFILTWTMALAAGVTANGVVAKASCPKVGFAVVEPRATPETRPVRMGNNQTIFVRREALTTTSDIADIRLAGDGDDALILIKFTPAADERLHDATTNHSGMRIAFLFDDEVLINVVWQGPYGMDTGGSQVSLRHGIKQARSLMKAIRGCTAAAAVDQRP